MKVVTRVQGQIETVKGQLTDRRADSLAVDAVFVASEHNKRLAGSLLASALAYRLFLWLLPVSLVASAGLGFLRDADTSSVGESVGMTEYVRSMVDDAAEQAHRSRWIILGIGLVALYSTSKSAARALRVIHQLAWGLPVAPTGKAWRSALGFVAFGLLALLVGLTVQVVKARWNDFGLLALLSTFVLYGALWLLASLVLPHGDAPWFALIPGALLVSLGVMSMHLFTFLYLGHKLESSSELYGALGAAAAILLWLYLVGYMIVASSVLNVTTWTLRTRAKSADP